MSEQPTGGERVVPGRRDDSGREPPGLSDVEYYEKDEFLPDND